MCGWPWQALWFCSSRSTRPEGLLQLARGINLTATRRPVRMSTLRATDAHEPLHERRYRPDRVPSLCECCVGGRIDPVRESGQVVGNAGSARAPREFSLLHFVVRVVQQRLAAGGVAAEVGRVSPGGAGQTPVQRRSRVQAGAGDGPGALVDGACVPAFPAVLTEDGGALPRGRS